ncbi:hypothetical protein HK407_04g07670 [Ordospora pajunii]|uniref:uncharacterized protein n=1 Tax=Ordospora pajunii TaxID=3039483 RepID=UPI00295274F8|nr:uncharacterized protein HK407_04g07670 [Ordospora pajunii]KAH9411659.1 hypothetical protein HK407_04g07670 [Ordospora pajunii]
MKIVVDTKYVTINAVDVIVILQVILLVAANYVIHKMALNQILKAGILTMRLLLLMYYFFLMLIEIYEEWKRPKHIFDVENIRNISFLCEFIIILALFCICLNQIKTNPTHTSSTAASILNKTAQVGGLYICVLSRKMFTKDSRPDLIRFIFSLIFISLMMVAILVDYVVHRRHIAVGAISNGQTHQFRDTTFICGMVLMPIGSLFKKDIEKDILFLKIGCSAIAILYIIVYTV